MKRERLSVANNGIAGSAFNEAGTPALDLNFAYTKTLPGTVTFARADASTCATYFDSNGTLQTAAANIPRFDHNPVTLESLGLLTEESRTNLLLNSETLSTQSVTSAATAYTLSFYGTGTVTLSGTSTAGPLVGTAENQRVSLTFTPTAGTLTLTVIGSVKYANLEAGSFATSWIKTVGSSLTRAADAASMTGANFSSWYNSTEGTFVAKADKTFLVGNYPAIWCIDDGTANNYIGVFHNTGATSRRYFVVVVGGVGQVFNDTVDASFGAGVMTSHAAAYKANNFAFSRSGEAAQKSSSGTVPTVNRLLLGQWPGRFINGHIARFVYYNTRLSDSIVSRLSA